MIDRRQYERVELSAPCRVSAAGLGRSPCNGVIENISRNGLLFQINGNFKNGIPAVGDFLAVDVLLPARRSFGQKSLRCRGSIVRMFPTAGGARIALAVEHMTFRSLGEPSRRKVAETAWDAAYFRA